MPYGIEIASNVTIESARDAINKPEMLAYLEQETPKIYYFTQQELLKNYISGAVLVIGVLILTYYAYKYYRAHYENWLLTKELEENDASTMEDVIPVDPRINKKVFLVIGAIIVIIGLVQILL